MCKNRKIVSLLIMATLIFSVMCTPLIGYAATLDYVKVGLKYAGNTVDTANVSASDGLAVASYSSSGFSGVTPLTNNGNSVTSVKAVNENGKIVLKTPSDDVVLDGLSEGQAIVSATGKTVKYETSEYRGGICLKPYLSKMVVINYLQIDEYVYGVLAAEIGSSSPKEAIKAQAVAARSFAGAGAGTHNSNGFDLCATTHCQVYKGVAGETSATNAATDETQGLMIYSEGKPVNAYYAKNSGGHTQNSEDVWYAALPYLRGVKDIYAPEYPWEATITFDKLKSTLESAGHKPGEIQSVSITKRSAAGAVYTLVIKGSENTVTLQKDAIRTTLGGSTIKSLMFSFVGSQSALAGSATGTGEFTYVVSSSGKTKVETNSLYVSNGSKTVKMTSGSTGSDQTVESVSNGTLYIKGYGYGHGVGMQQDGAIAMGKQGLNFKEILQFYYTGIEIK